MAFCALQANHEITESTTVTHEWTNGVRQTVAGMSCWEHSIPEWGWRDKGKTDYQSLNNIEI